MKALIPQRLQTTRLIAERPVAEHEPDLARLARDPRVYPTLWRPGCPTSSTASIGRRRGAVTAAPPAPAEVAARLRLTRRQPL